MYSYPIHIIKTYMHYIHTYTVPFIYNTGAINSESLDSQFGLVIITLKVQLHYDAGTLF